MKSKYYNTFYSVDTFLLAIAMLLNLLFQFYIIKLFGSRSVTILLAYNFALSSLVAYLFIVKRLELFLVFLYLLQYIYLNQYFHYNILYEIVIGLPILLLFGLTVLDYLKHNSIKLTLDSTFQKILFAFILFAFIQAFWGYYNHAEMKQILTELYRSLNYGFVFFFLMIFKKSKDYNTILAFLYVITIIIALEYVGIYFLTGVGRFVTFQSNMIPGSVAVGFVFMLYSKHIRYKIFWASLTFITSLGALVSLTRSIWVTVFFAIGIILIIYLRYEKGVSPKIIKVMVVTVVLLLGLIATQINKSERLTSDSINKVEYRASSIFDPTEDISLLMRVELSYYAIIKALESPIIGTGYGDYVKYKILPGNNYKQYYLDISWVMFFWKGGIVGLSLFLALYAVTLINAFRNYLYCTDKNIQLINLIIFVTFSSFIVLGFFAPLLIKYKLNLIYAFLFAYVEYHSLQRNKTKSNVNGIKH